MNRFRFFGRRPIFYFAEPAGGDAGGTGGADSGAGTSSSGGSGGGGAEAGASGSSASPQSDEQLLDSVAEKPSGAAPDAAAAATKTEEAVPEVNLDAIQDGQPEWLAKITDAAAKAEVEKLLGFQKQFADWFKDDADRDAFMQELPGGREQIAALQTLSKEVVEMDGHIAANTPEGNLTVAGRYLSEAPDGGVGLLRAGAQHLAKANPEAYNGIATELMNASLKGAGIGADFAQLTGAIAEMRAAVEAQDGEAFGKAAGKLLGAPLKTGDTSADPRLAKAQTEREAAQKEVTTAKTEVWNVHIGKAHSDATNHMKQAIGTALAAKDASGRPLISDVISADSRQRLADTIYADVDAQLMADPWYVSQMKQLIGNKESPNLAAKQEDFAKAIELTKARVGKLLGAGTIKKHVETWARDVVAKSGAAIARAKGAAAGGDRVGAAPAVGSGGKVRPLSDEALAKMSPDERDDAILGLVTRTGRK